ncbi:MAG: reverse transcriptase/maturase family protein, partial [Patescibacteria group bacterium]
MHSKYESFVITDPKRRQIHKASVRDRIIHHALYRMLYPFFDRTFASDSFSCRDNKGMHKAIDRFRTCTRKENKNHFRTCWVLKCDIKQFFASIDHRILMRILEASIPDADIRSLLKIIIQSFETANRHRVGLPLGNLTSQLFSNIYMNRFDQFVKHKLKIEYYIRYVDDFVFLSPDKQTLKSLIPRIRSILLFDLHLTLHPTKILLKTIASGVDFLGWAHFPDHRVLRTVTRRRMFKRIDEHT